MKEQSEIERMITVSEDYARHRSHPILKIFVAMVFVSVVIFTTFFISLGVLRDTVTRNRLAADGSADEFQDVRYTLVNGDLSKEYLSDEEVAKAEEKTEEKKEEEKPESEKKEEPKTETAITPANGKKPVYLTFDDGPGNYTAELLDILKKYNVKATFFVTCRGDDKVLKREFDEGHTVALHTCSHKYDEVYRNDEAYFQDLEKVSERVSKVTGKETKMVRLPGGSSNTVSAKYNKGIMSRITAELEKRGYTYVDWNVVSKDTDGTKSADEIFQNVVNGVNGKGDGVASVVLQHDLKDYSVRAVEKIVQYGLKNGYEFLAMDETSPTAHHRVNN